MKLLFNKDEDSRIYVTQNINGEESDFSYVDMINSIIESKKMEEPDISDDFTEEEKNSINNMVKLINNKIAEEDDDDSDKDEDFDLEDLF